MHKKVKVGLVGCGNVATKSYLPAIISSDKVELICVCDVVEERVKQAKEEFSAKEYYLDYSEMLQKTDIEAVVILTSPKFHFSLSMEALKAGKHVYTEKTMGLTLEEADALIKKAKEMNVKLVAAPAIILNPINQHIKKIIKKGLIGKVCFICAHSSHGGAASWDNFTTDPTFYYKKGSGPLYDLGVYSLHTLTGIMGPAKRVTSFSGISIPEVIVKSGVVKGKKIKVEVDDNTLILLDFGENTFAYLDATYTMKENRGPGTIFYGSEGIIATYGNYGYNPTEVETYIGNKEFMGMKGWFSKDNKNTIWTIGDGVLHLADCIRENKKPIASAEHARHVMEIMLKTYESAKSGQAQNITSVF